MADESTVSLREHVNQRFLDFDRRLSDARESDDKRVQLALTAAKEAVDKADQANDRRLDLLNEFRGQQSDESKKYALRESVDQAIRGLEKDVSLIQGRALAMAGFGALIGGAIVGVLVKFLS